MTLGVLFALRDHPRFRGARLYALAGMIGAGAGFLSEVIQKPLARDASWEDVVADTIGVVCALAVYALFDRRLDCGVWQRVGVFAIALVVRRDIPAAALLG